MKAMLTVGYDPDWAPLDHSTEKYVLYRAACGDVKLPLWYPEPEKVDIYLEDLLQKLYEHTGDYHTIKIEKLEP